MRHKSIFDEYTGIVVALIVVPALTVPVVVFHFLRNAPAWLAVLVAGAACIPAGLAVFFPLLWFDRARSGDRSTSDRTGLTGSGLLYAQALVFLYAPALSNNEDGDPLRAVGLLDWAICLAAAAATAGAGYALKKRRERRLALAKLATTHPHTATRFIVRVDRNGWAEIDPGSVLRYQAAFEKALLALGPPPNSLRYLSGDQERDLVRCARDLRNSWPETTWPFVTLALVLIYIDSPAAERDRDRADWAAAVATNPDARRVRDWVQPIAMGMFERPDPPPKFARRLTSSFVPAFAATGTIAAELDVHHDTLQDAIEATRFVQPGAVPRSSILDPDKAFNASRQVGPRELHQANVAFATMVRGFLTGPFAQREPAKAKAWLGEIGPAIGHWSKARDVEAMVKAVGPGPAERHFIQNLDKLLNWALIGLLELGPDEAPAAREALQPYIDIVLREGRQRRMWLRIEEWAGSLPGTSKSNVIATQPPTADAKVQVFEQEPPLTHIPRSIAPELTANPTILKTEAHLSGLGGLPPLQMPPAEATLPDRTAPAPSARAFSTADAVDSPRISAARRRARQRVRILLAAFVELTRSVEENLGARQAAGEDVEGLMKRLRPFAAMARKCSENPNIAAYETHARNAIEHLLDALSDATIGRQSAITILRGFGVDASHADGRWYAEVGSASRG